MYLLDSEGADYASLQNELLPDYLMRRFINKVCLTGKLLDATSKFMAQMRIHSFFNFNVFFTRLLHSVNTQHSSIEHKE